ncbi:hypothetical protein MTO96_011267 [Rhipicephalus appendiculatus]
MGKTRDDGSALRGTPPRAAAGPVRRRQRGSSRNPNQGKKKKAKKVGWAEIAANPKAPANTHTTQAINKCNECASIRRELEVTRAKCNELTRKVDNLMKAIKDRDINAGGQGEMRATAGKGNSGKDMHVSQATAPRVDQTASMKNAQTAQPPLEQLQLQQEQTQSQLTQQIQQFQSQLSEVKSALRKKLHTDKIKKKAYNRPSFPSGSDSESNQA